VSAFLADLAELQRGGYKQLLPIVVDMNTIGETEYRIPCNSICIPANLMLPGGLVVATQTTKRVWLRINDVNNPWLPFSLNAADYAAIGASVNRFWVRVDAANQLGAGVVTLLLCGLGVNLSGPGGGSGSLVGYAANVSASAAVHD
jgi:hypothetical protein